MIQSFTSRFLKTSSRCPPARHRRMYQEPVTNTKNTPCRISAGVMSGDGSIITAWNSTSTHTPTMGYHAETAAARHPRTPTPASSGNKADPAHTPRRQLKAIPEANDITAIFEKGFHAHHSFEIPRGLVSQQFLQ